jgi:hypothetical protein
MDGTEWLLIFGIAGFFISFALAKINILNDSNSTKFVTWAPAIPAAVMAIGADISAGGLSEIFGRLAIFALVWFCGGLLFAFGSAIGTEKAVKKNGENEK